MMKKLVVRFLMLLFVLGMSMNAAWGQIQELIGAAESFEDPTNWFYVNLNARVSNPNCGTNNPGQVWLISTEAAQTEKLDKDGNPINLLDEKGDPIPELNEDGTPIGGDAYLHVKERKAHNPWITNTAKPAQPTCPYRDAEYVDDLRQKWNDGYDQGKAAHDAGTEKSYTYGNGWTDEQKGLYRDGYDNGFAGRSKDNPYYNGYATNDQACNYWTEDGYRHGLEDAKAGKSRTEILTNGTWTTNLNPALPYTWESGDYWGAMREWQTKNGYYAGFDWWHDWYTNGHYLNAANPVGFASSTSLKGVALLYAPGMEDIEAMGYVFSSYAYFYGKAQENDGWYFTGWSYTEGESDLGGVVAESAENDSTMFRVLPSATPGEANKRIENVYATFKPVLVADYKVGGMINVGTEATNFGETTVVFDAVGERVSTADFTASVEGANFVATSTSCTDNKVTVTVRYTNPGALEEDVYRGNVKLVSKSGCSELTAAVYARVGGVSSSEATLYDGKTPTATSGTLKDMIAAANGTDLIVVLNRNYTSNLKVNATVTIDLNGYNMDALTVSGGEVTIAYNKYGGRGTSATVTGGKLILNGAEFGSLNIRAGATVEQNGALITGAVTNNGTLIATEGHVEGGLSSAGTLTINGGTFEGATAIAVTGGTATVNKATISGTTYGIRTTGGTTEVTSKLVTVYGGTQAVYGNGGTIQLSNGKYDASETPLAGTIDLQAGYFKVDGAHLGIDVLEGKKVLNVLAGIDFAAGYRYFVGDDASTVGVCRIGTTAYAKLEDALAYANNNTDKSVVIIMTNDYTLPAGYYTLPSNATLIVPMSNDQETGYEIVNRVSSNSANKVAYVQPYEFRRLTFAAGVNLDVHGTIELTGTQRAADDAYASMPHGPYGHLVMDEGSHMTLQNGSLLRAWGYMTGKGETDARRGSKVREQFQMGDWKGGSISFSMLDDDRRVFPITQYFIQNVESPVKYHPGALLSTTASVSAAQGGMGITAMANDIIVVGVSGGDPAMFFMDQEADAENTWVRKWYNPETDVQTYDVNSGAHIGSMVLDLGKLGTSPLVMNSGQFVLPITNNMKIHLLTGLMDFTQTTALLPGAEVEVDKESTVTIYADDDDLRTLSSFESQWRTYESEHSNWEADPSIGEEPVAPKKPILSTGELFVYDADEWGNYAKGKNDDGIKYTKVVKYSATLDAQPGVRSETTKPGDATINVHGTFNTGEGAVYTTAGGANIFSNNEDAGSFIVNRSTPTYTAKIYQVKNASASSYESTDAVSAKLKNGAGAEEAYTATAGTGTNLAFLYRDNTWQNPIKDNVQTFYFDCYTAEVDMNAYAADVMAKVNNIAIYHAPDNIAECLVGMALAQSLNMSLTPANYETMKANGLLSNYMATIQGQVASMKAEGYDLGGAVQHIYIKPQEWLEIAAQAHIKLNFDQDYIDELGDSYDEGNYNDAVNAYMEYVQAQAYNPYLEGVEGNADHTYSDADGAGRLFILMPSACQWWEVEKKDNLYHCIHPNNDTYYYWLDDPDEEDPIYGEWKEKTYTITWKNWNGTIIQTKNKDEEMSNNYVVTYGTMAEFLGTNPTREATIDYTYDFTGWTPALGPVTSNVTYTATFTEKPRMYTIIFLQEGGVEIERHFLKHNEIPVCENVPTKVGHTLQWDPAIAAVTGDATYTATWLENPPTEYKVVFLDFDGDTLQQSNVAVGVMPEYTGATPTGKATWAEEQENKEFTYVFDHWSPALEEVSATSIKSYTAVYREVAKTYTIKFVKENGDPDTPADVIESHEYHYGETPVCSVLPTKDATPQYTYTLRWTPQIQTVMANANYTAVFDATTNKYTVTLKANPSGACTFTGAGTFDYGTAISISRTDNDGYSFVNWTDKDGNTVSDLPTTLTGDVDLVANFDYEGDATTYTINWREEDGTLIKSVTQVEGTATIYTGATPTKDATAAVTYTFYGWTAAKDGTDSIKNGMTPKATNNADYYAFFTKTPRKYTISWKNEAGTADIEVDYDQPYGATIEYNSATPTKQATAAATYAFDGWSTSQGGEVAEVPTTVSGNAVFYAHFAATPKTYTVTWKRDDGSLIDNTEVAYGVTPSHADPTKPATQEESYTFDHWDRDFEPVEGLTSYTAYFSSTTNTYTITWVDGDGNTLETEDVEYGDTPSYDGETPTKTETTLYTYEFTGWSPMILPVSGNTTYVAQFDATPKSNNIEIGINESEDLDDDYIERSDLVITSNGVASGQLLGAENLTITGEAIFRLEQDLNAATWYAVAVPWTVDPNTGIYAGSSHLSSGSQIYVIEFDANEYAGGSTNTYDYWHFLHETGNDMVPGKLYMIYLASAQTSLDFHKKADAPIWTTETAVAVTGGDGVRDNWNAIANPALYTADLSTGVSTYQVYDNNGDQSYTPIDGATSGLIVAKPIFVQVATPSTVYATIPSASPAPYRRVQKAETDAKFVVEINRNNKMADRLIIETADEKEDKYVIGQDLAKFGVSSKVAQMWINRYDAKLCKNTVEFDGERADYPLNIFSPAAGEYTLHLTPYTSGSDYALYLTLNGEAIWNLSDAAYTLTLQKGNTAEYGLRISVRKAPEVVTGMDEAVVEAQGDIRKVLINNQVFIIRGDKVYTIDGQMVK